MGSSNLARSSAVSSFRAFQHRSVSTWSAVCCTSLKKEPSVGEPQNMHFILVLRVCSLLPQLWFMCRVRLPLFERVSWHVGHWNWGIFPERTFKQKIFRPNTISYNQDHNCRGWKINTSIAFDLSFQEITDTFPKSRGKHQSYMQSWHNAQVSRQMLQSQMSNGNCYWSNFTWYLLYSIWSHCTNCAWAYCILVRWKFQTLNDISLGFGMSDCSQVPCGDSPATLEERITKASVDEFRHFYRRL